MPAPKLDARDVLRQLPLFRQLSATALEEVARRTVLRSLPRNAILFREGDACRGLYVVLDGSVKVYRARTSGQEHVLHVELPKHPVGELPLFDGGPYPASARAAEDSWILFLPRDAFQALYRQNPEIADAVIAELGRRLRKLVGLVGKLTLKDVSARVATALLEEAAAAGAAREGSEFTLPVTQEELAATLGTTRESVARALIRFRKDGVIAQKGGDVRILDLAALQDAAGSPPPGKAWQE